MKTPIMGFFAPKCTIKGLIGFLCATAKVAKKDGVLLYFFIILFFPLRPVIFLSYGRGKNIYCTLCYSEE